MAITAEQEAQQLGLGPHLHKMPACWQSQLETTSQRTTGLATSYLIVLVGQQQHGTIMEPTAAVCHCLCVSLIGREINRGGLEGLYLILLEDSGPYFAAALRHISSECIVGGLMVVVVVVTAAAATAACVSCHDAASM